MSDRHSNAWAVTLTVEQRRTVSEIRHYYNGGWANLGSDGWTVYMMPSVGPARYLELHHYQVDGRVSRWQIDTDGTVLADNDLGRLRYMRERELTA